MTYTAWSVIAGETPTATKWNLLGGNDADFDTRISALLAAKTLYEEADASTITFDMDNSNIQIAELGGNRTLAVANYVVGIPFILLLKQGTGGNKVPTWFTTIQWAGGSAPTLTTTAGKVDIFQFIPVDDSPETFYGMVAGQNI